MVVIHRPSGNCCEHMVGAKSWGGGCPPGDQRVEKAEVMREVFLPEPKVLYRPSHTVDE